jgi:DNA polymerase-1
MALRFSRNGGIMIESLEELNKIAMPGKTLFLDLETTSFDDDKMSVNPWHDCWVLGVCVKTEETPAYYIPVNHRHYEHNIDATEVQQWLVNVAFEGKARWVNHNIKYDAHVLYNALGIDASVPLYDTLDLAKLVDSDRMRYSLDALSYDWLKHDINVFEDAFSPYLKNGRGHTICKDYGAVPPDIMAEYGCQDVITNEKLWNYIGRHMPPESMQLVEISSQLTEVCLRMERHGMPINMQMCKERMFDTLSELIKIETELEAEVGYAFLPHNSKDCFDVLCCHYGLPVLAYTEGKKSDDSEPLEGDAPKGNPSFAADVLRKYLAHPEAPRNVIEKMLRYRRLKTFISYFLEPWDELEVNNFLHGSYNATVRTGRMSCSKPNMQQLMDEAKDLVVTHDEDYTIGSIDYSQIEFRMIVHYIRDESCIKSYNDNPLTDFHDWVRDMCQIDRKSAKTSNFLMGYGGGKSTLIKQLISIDTLVSDIIDELKSDPDYLAADSNIKSSMFTERATSRATGVYNKYHDTLPGIRITSRAAMNKVLSQGYVTNWFGRRRKLPPAFAYKAFNNLCQGSSADFMKERLCSLHYWLRDNVPEVVLIGVIHDEVLFYGPTSCMTDYVLNSISYILEDSSRPFRIPIRTSLGLSTKSWYEAVHDDSIRDFDRLTFRPDNYQQTYDRGLSDPWSDADDLPQPTST